MICVQSPARSAWLSQPLRFGREDVAMADQARSHGSGFYRVDAHDPVAGGRDNIAVAVLAIGDGRCSRRASRNSWSGCWS